METYEGAAQFVVHGGRDVGAVSDFVRQMRGVPGIRVSRLIDNRLGGADVLLSLRLPMKIRDILAEMSGVVWVSPLPVRSLVPGGDAATVMLMLIEVRAARRAQQT